MTDDRTRGVHLSDKQLVFVFMASTVVAVVVFLFGVLVGRGVQNARGPLTGSGTMAASDVVSDGTAGEAPVADGVPRPEAGTGAGGGDKYTYQDLLGKAPPAERNKAGAAPASAAAGTPAPPEVPADPVSAAGGPPTPPPAAAPVPAATYTVQVAAVKQRSEADTIVKHLKTKGYDAFVLAPESGDRVGVFRVRIGSFKDKRQADMLAERLLRDEKRYKPWVTR